MTDMSPVSLHGHGQPEPIGLEYIAGSLTHVGVDIQFVSASEFRVSIPESCYQFALFSCTTAECPQVLRSARVAKDEGFITAVGGYHACGSPGEMLEGPFDYVITGEGEKACTELIRAISDGGSISLESAVISEHEPRLISAHRIADLDAVPRPYRSERFLGTYILYDLMWPTQSQQKNTAIVLASRGCSHDCDFCASSTVWGHGIRFRSPGKVVEELQDLKSRFATNTIVFIDQSLGQARDWTIDLCGAIEEANLGLSWYHQSNLDIDRSVLPAMARAGCKKIGFGLEGISPRSIERLKPINPKDFAELNTLFDYCNSLGIFVKLYVMIGFPWETDADISEYMDCIGQLRANEVKISYFTPFPGTRGWEQYSNSLVTKNWADFDTVAMPVVHNPSISVDQYHRIRHDLFQAFYGSQTYAEVTRSMLERFPHYAESYREFLLYLKSFHMISGREKWVEWVEDAGSRQFQVSTPQWREL